MIKIKLIFFIFVSVLAADETMNIGEVNGSYNNFSPKFFEDGAGNILGTFDQGTIKIKYDKTSNSYNIAKDLLQYKGQKMTNFIKTENGYYISACPTDGLILRGSSSSDTETMEIVQIQDNGPESVQCDITTIDKITYYVTYGGTNKVDCIIAEYDSIKNTAKIIKVFKDLVEYSERELVFNCQYFDKIKKFFCMVAICGGMNGKLTFYLVNASESFSISLNSKYPFGASQQTTSVEGGQLYKINEGFGILCIRTSESAINYYYITFTPGSENEESRVNFESIDLRFENINSKHDNVFVLNDSSFLIYSATKEPKATINFYDVSSPKTVLLNPNDGTFTSNYFQIIPSNDSDDTLKLISVYNEDSKTKIKLYILDLIECSNTNLILKSLDGNTFKANQLTEADIQDDSLKINIISKTWDEENVKVTDNQGKGVEIGKDKSYSEIKIQINNKESSFLLKYYLSKSPNQYGFTAISPSCEIPVDYFCWESCKKCTDTGSESEHKCTECKDDYYMEKEHDGIVNKNNCFTKDTPGYFFKELPKSAFRCYPSCKKCSSLGNSRDHKCDECLDLYVTKDIYTGNVDDQTSCAQYCDLDYFSWYVNPETEEIECESTGKNCPVDKPYQNASTGQCLSKCADSSNCELNIDNSIQTIKKLLEGNISEIKDHVTIIETSELIFHITSSDNTEPVNDTLGYIELNECENKLKTHYNLGNTPLLIGIIELKNSEENASTNQIEYSVFDSEGNKLDLSYCNGTNITVVSSVQKEKINMTIIDQLSGLSIDAFNTTEDFFNDYCTPFTSEDGTDVTINDRRTYYFQNTSLCDSNCSYVSYQEDTKKASCTCLPKVEINEEVEGRTLTESFKLTIESSNFKLFKCSKVFFSNKIFKGFGFYLELIIFILEIANFIVFLFTPNKIPLNIKRDPTHLPSPPKFKDTSEENPQESEGENEKENDKDPDIPEISCVDNPNPNLNPSPNPNPDTSKTKGQETVKIFSSSGTESSEYRHYNQENSGLLDDTNFRSFICLEKTQTMKYLKITQFFNKESDLKSLLKSKNPIYLTFFSKDMSRVKRHLQIAIFLMYISANFTFNSFFYSDYYISENYKNKGGYKLYLEIPKIFYSYLLFGLFNIILKLTIQIRASQITDKKRKAIQREKRRFIIRYSIFFGLIFVMHCFFLYFTSIFCVVYHNVIPNWIICSTITLVLGYAIVPTIYSLIMYLMQKGFIKYQNGLFFAVGELMKLF